MSHLKLDYAISKIFFSFKLTLGINTYKLCHISRVTYVLNFNSAFYQEGKEEDMVNNNNIDNKKEKKTGDAQYNYPPFTE